MLPKVDGDKITFTYTPGRIVHGYARSIHATSFMAHSPDTTPVGQLAIYEDITWEHGWTDGRALLAAHALAVTR